MIFSQTFPEIYTQQKAGPQVMHAPSRPILPSPSQPPCTGTCTRCPTTNAAAAWGPRTADGGRRGGREVAPRIGVKNVSRPLALFKLNIFIRAKNIRGRGAGQAIAVRARPG